MKNSPCAFCLANAKVRTAAGARAAPVPGAAVPAERRAAAAGGDRVCGGADRGPGGAAGPPAARRGPGASSEELASLVAKSWPSAQLSAATAVGAWIFPTSPTLSQRSLLGAALG